MPRLNSEQARVLLQVLDKTLDEELTCDDSLPHLAAWAENELEGREQPETLGLVDAHLSICPECIEELDALREAIRALKPE